MAYTHLEPGTELEISSRAYYSSGQENIAELVKLSTDELNRQEETSTEQEKVIYEKMLELSKEWEQQAEKTLGLRKARQYLRTPAVSHTANVWNEDRYGWHERSNMVYKFSWRVNENTRWDSSIGKSIIKSWSLSWFLVFNTPANPDYTGSGRQLAGQSGKVFTDQATLEKYLQGRISAYSKLFLEISPPIPAEHEKRFCINGVLLPGYTVGAPERTPQEVADELLRFLEDGDAPPSAADRPAHMKPQPHKHRGSTPVR